LDKKEQEVGLGSSSSSNRAPTTPIPELSPPRAVLENPKSVRETRTKVAEKAVPKVDKAKFDPSKATQKPLPKAKKGPIVPKAEHISARVENKTVNRPAPKSEKARPEAETSKSEVTKLASDKRATDDGKKRKRNGSKEVERGRRRPASPVFTSSDESETELAKARPRKLPNITKISPAPLPSSLPTKPTTTTDPVALRDRYEELYPAYHLMTQRLVKAHATTAAELLEEGEIGYDEAVGHEVVKREELATMVKKWEKWHHELAGIRRWFGQA
jgi:hypothetical protein